MEAQKEYFDTLSNMDARQKFFSKLTSPDASKHSEVNKVKSKINSLIQQEIAELDFKK